MCNHYARLWPFIVLILINSSPIPVEVTSQSLSFSVIIFGIYIETDLGKCFSVKDEVKSS